MRRCFHILAFLLTLACGLSQTTLSFAQDQPTGNAARVTDLSQLPGFLKLKSEVMGWSKQDDEIAMGQIKAWLKENQKDFPIDCTFRVRGPIHRDYETGESRTTVENALRRLNQGYVGFYQVAEWSDYPKTAPGFKEPQHQEWDSFKREILPGLEQAFTSAYLGSVPAELQRLELNGYQGVCNEIKDYLQRRFKAAPKYVFCNKYEEYTKKIMRIKQGIDSEVSYSSSFTSYELYSVGFYKLSYPHADGLNYSQLSIEGCTFEQPKPIVEKKLEEPSAQKYVPTKEVLASSRKSQKREEKEARLKEAKEWKEWQAKEKAAQKKYDEEAKERVRKSELEMEDRRLKIYQPKIEGTQPEVRSHNELGEELKQGYKKQHKVDWRNQEEFDLDETKLNELQAEVSKTEEEWVQDFNKKYPDQPLEFKKVKLDPKEPFSVLQIPVDVELTSFEIESVIKALQKQKHKWIFGCVPKTLVRKDNNGVELPQKTYIECLVPNFIVESNDPNKEPRVISIPLPSILNTYRDVKNQCNVSTGIKEGRGLGLKQVPIFKSRGKTERVDGAWAGVKNKTLPKEFSFRAGIRSRTVDLFTKKIIPAATVTVKSRDNTYVRTTDAKGEFVIEDVQLKGLNRQMLGQHRKYYDGASPIQKIVIDEIAKQDDIFLDPKRILMTGKISETSRPKYGSGIKGIKVGFEGYPEFQTETDENGFYSIKNVPASLEDFFINDPTEGHKVKTVKVDLNPDQDNDNMDYKIEPNLTVVEGRVTSRNKPVEGLQVILPGFPEYVVVTDAEGRYRFEDIPPGVNKVEVLSDPEVIYIGKMELIPGFKAYKTHQRDVVVKYNRSDITGRVYDVVSKAGIAGVKVYVEGGEEKYSAVTDSYGAYKITKVPPTATTLLLKEVDKKYVWRPRAIDPALVAGEDRDQQDFRLVPRDYIKNNIVFILTWNDRQKDLDSQIFLPDSRHLYFKTLRDNTFATTGGATLDIDDTGTTGRETTVIYVKDGKTVQPGTYRFLVYQYHDNKLDFQQAGALVEVYKDGEFLQEIKPGPGKGRVWFVGLVENEQLNVIDKFPAGELYQRLSDLEEELKDNDKREEKEKQLLTTLENQETTFTKMQENQMATLTQKRADLELIQQGKQPVLPVNIPRPPVQQQPTAQVPPGQAPTTQPVPTQQQPTTQVPPGQVPTTQPVPTQQPPVQQPAAPKPPTQAELIAFVTKEVADLDKQAAGTTQQLAKIRDEIGKKKVFIQNLPEWLKNRNQEIENEKKRIDAQIEQILQTYR